MSSVRRAAFVIGGFVTGLFLFTYFWPRDLVELIVDNRTGESIRVTCSGTGLSLTVTAHSIAEDRIYRGTERAIVGERLGVAKGPRVSPAAILQEDRWTATQYVRVIRLVFK